MEREAGAALLSIVIPTLNAEKGLSATLAALGHHEGLAPEIVVADGGSSDGTAERARRLGARVVESPRGRGPQFATGAAAATGDWLLFLHADTVLEPGWAGAVRAFVAEPTTHNRAAVFAFALDDPRPAARRLERIVAWRCRTLGLAYGDQGLLIHRDLYASVGGFRPLPLMEDVDLIRRIGRRRITLLKERAVTSAERYRAGGYWRRPLRNLVCLNLYFLGVPPRMIARLYG